MSLKEWVKYRDTGYLPALHHRLLIEHLEAVERGDIDRLMVCMPPGSAKSTYTSVEFPPWFMGRNPELNVIAASHTQDLAETFGRRARNVVASDEYRAVFGFGLNQDSQAAGRWANEQGGEYYAAGVGGAIAGRRADLVLIDDPVKSQEDADSERARARAWDWYVSDLLTRLKPGGRQICVMCMVGDTPVLMADGSEKPLSDVRPGDRVATYKDGRIAVSTLVNWVNQGPDQTYEIRTRAGKIVRANERHPFLVERDGVPGWRRLRDLKVGDKMFRVERGAVSCVPSTGAASESPARAFAPPTTTRPSGPAATGLHRPALNLGERPASNIDTASTKGYTGRCSKRKTGSAQSATNHPARMCAPIGAASCAWTTITRPARSVDSYATTATSSSDTERQRTCSSAQLDTYAITLDPIESIAAAGVEDVFDVQIAETENFIANGLVSHNTRWHEEDLGGRILEREGHRWTLIEIPMEAYANDPLGRKPGEMLWPDYFTPDMLERAKMNPRSWNALYQQRPSPEDGTFFKREYFKTWAAKPKNLNVYGTSDYAVTDSGGDFTVHRVWGVDQQGDLYRLDGWRGQSTADVWIDRKLDLIERYKPFAWFGESGVIQKAVQPMLTSRMHERKVYCRMEWLPSISDKPTRARGFQARAASGRVYFEPGADIDEFLKFPAGKYDDDVDTASLIGRALDEAHPAVVPAPKKDAFVDRWDRKFNADRGGAEDDWRTK